MFSRRDTLRLLALAAVAAPAASMLAACADGQADGGPVEPTEAELDLVSSAVTRTPGVPDAVPEVVSALHRLAGDLYGALSTADGNLALSPYSIAVALGMTLNGAGGVTAEEMRGVLGVDETE